MGLKRRVTEGTTGPSSCAKKQNIDPNRSDAKKQNPDHNTTAYVQILGTGMDTQDTSPSVLLFFDHHRFIFNVGEGLQRFCTEHKIKLSKIDHVLLTRVCSETAGGLPGLLLTLAGIGERGILVDIWGPSNLKYLVNAMRSFVPNAAMVHTHSFGALQGGDDPTISSFKTAESTDPITLIDDTVVRISAILLRPGYARDVGDTMARDNISDLGLLQSEENLNGHLVSCSHSLDNTGSTMKPGDIAVIYICELPDIVGDFYPNTASNLGVCKNNYSELKRGNPVMSDTLNKLINPSDVLGPSTPGPVLLLVDCPTLFHMKEMLTLKSLDRYYVDSFYLPRESMKYVNCVIHLGPASVTKNADYQMWMKRFGKTQHIMAGHEIKDSEIHILRSSARISSRLNFLCPQLFPAPGIWPFKHFDNQLQNPDGKIQDMENFLAEDLLPKIREIISAENLLKFILRPVKKQGLDRSVIPDLVNHAEIVNELLLEIPEIVNVSKYLSHFWKNANGGNEVTDVSNDATTFLNGSFEEATKDNADVPACLENITREDMEIIFLGTGSSQPSKFRNVSSILVNLFSKGTFLVDCGEGTLAQLRRRFGVEGADNSVKGLHFIWISHIHADHHSGLVRILSLRSQLLKGICHKPLLVIGPEQLKRFLDAYCVLEDLDMMFLDCRHTTQDSVETIFRCLHSNVNYPPHHSDHEDDRHGVVENAIFQSSETSVVVDGDKTQINGKNTAGRVDSSIPMTVLTRYKEVLHEAGLEALYSFPVVHCHEAFGLLLKSTERISNRGKIIPGWKLVYSGDTRPCQSMIDASRDATILIHEATFEDSMGKEAIAKKHSTTMEALEVGASAGVYRTILTHFSQRYPKIPVFDEIHMKKACVAFDLMSVNLADLPMLPTFLPCLKVLFKNEIIEDEVL